MGMSPSSPRRTRLIASLYSWLTLLNPVMFDKIHENTLHIFGIVNFLSIPMVWALYPETANRTLEEMDLLFASKSPWVWDEEEHFARLKREMVEGKLVAPDTASVAGSRDEKERVEASE